MSIEHYIRQINYEFILHVSLLATYGLMLFFTFTLATFLLIKGLLLERRSPLGRALGRNNLAMSFTYYSFFFGAWIPILRHPFLRLAIIIIACSTALAAIRQFAIVYGGWRSLADEAWHAAVEVGTDLARLPASMCTLAKRSINDFWRNHAVKAKMLVVLALFVVLVVFVVLERF